MEDLFDRREEMVEKQLKRRGSQNKRVLDAMKKVPRDKLVAHNLVEFAYDDTPLPIDEEQTISQPYIVVLKAVYRAIKPDDMVLDIGTGSGCAAAVLREIAEKVYTIERHEKLAKTAQKRFDRLRYDNIFVLHRDGTEDWRDTDITTPNEAPFKRFPKWMWNNEETLDFAKWLKEYNNQKSSTEEKVRFYGHDLYSMYTSIHAIIDYLEDIDSELAEIARNRYGCLPPTSKTRPVTVSLPCVMIIDSVKKK